MTAAPASFDALVDDWVCSHRSLNTRAAYRSDIDVFRSWWGRHRRRAPLTATEADVDRFEQACVDAGGSEATVARRVSALSSFFTFAVVRGAIARSPVRGVRRPPTTATPTADLDAVEVADVVRSSARHGARASLLVGLLLFDGLKLAEVLAAEADDVAIKGRDASITVLRHGHRVGQQLDRRTASAAITYLAGRTDGPLLLGESPTRPSGRLTRYGVDYLLKRISADAGLTPAISANTLRRSYVATAVAGGASVESIRERLGHTDIRTTRRHLSDDGS